MKVVGKEGPRVTLIVNMDELLLLKGMIETTKLNLPRTVVYYNDRQRLKNMFSRVKRFISRYETEKYNELKGVE